MWDVVGHELRTPVALLKGYLHLLQRAELTCADDLPLGDVLAGIEEATTRLSGLAELLADVAALERGTLPLTPRALAVPEWVGSVLAPYQAALIARRLQVHTDLHISVLRGDPDALGKALSQVVSNAIKYTPDGGRITLSGYAHLEAGRHFALLAVADSGIGIAPEHREAIFAPFFRVGPAALHSSGRTKFKGGGPGLGLSLARAVVEAHGGRMWVESPGYDEVACPGSTVYLVLPA